MKKKNKSKFVAFFETKDSVTNDDRHKSAETEDDYTINRIKRFIKDYGKQSLKYKVVWGIRIFCWAIIFIVFSYFSIKSYFV